MNQQLINRLRRMGVGRGREGIKPAKGNRRARLVENLMDGDMYRVDDSACFCTETVFPLGDNHGKWRVGSLLDVSSSDLAKIANIPELEQNSIDQFLFIDTETTGLSLGTGTIAFMVGVGHFIDSGFKVKQYFLRSPDDEPSMLDALRRDMEQHPVLVSFNGRAFDIPLLENRYTLFRQVSPTFDSLHLDLLPAARKLWRNVLPSCRLIALERDILEVTRDQADVPGGEIPLIYRDYLRSGNGVEMVRVFYHNQIDVLSMATLAAHISKAFSQSDDVLHREGEWLALGRWFESLGYVERAEKAYETSISRLNNMDHFQDALNRLGWLQKRDGRRDESTVSFRQLASIEHRSVDGHVEMAKYHEWHSGDLVKAAEWTAKAIKNLDSWPRGMAQLVRGELQHRLDRLERKLDRARLKNSS